MKESQKNLTQLVSILIPTYNAGPYLHPAIQSVLNQSYKNIEVIVIDDGSTDDSLSCVKDFADKRLNVIRQQNSGKAVALNRGLEIVKGDYWVIQDADDLSHPNRIATLLDEMVKRPDVAAVYSGHDILINQMQFAPTFTPMSTADCRLEIENFRIPAHDATGMYRTSMVHGIKFDPELRIGQGIDFVLKVGEKFPVIRVGYCLYSYRINLNSTIRKEPQKNKQWVDRALSKAHERRGTKKANNYQLKKDNSRKKSELNHIVSHCMNSVVDLKANSNWFKAIAVGTKCVEISPFDSYFYKPLVYSVLPLFIINMYRSIKTNK